MRRPASGEQYRSEHEDCRDSIHGRSSPIGCGGVIPGASTPARIANATFSRVGTRGCRTTINPATTAESHLRCHEPQPVDVALKQRVQQGEY